ncbi:MAG: S41 family peptidase [Sphingomonadaceae bacterium]
MKISHVVAALLLGASTVPAAHAELPRFPQPSGNSIVFVADGNVWSVPKQGGTAIRLTSAQGQDMFPRVSPDGRWIAYTEASNAGTDIWVIPASGGKARRLTYHPAAEAGTGGRHGPDNMVLTWTPDSQYVVYLSKRDAWNDWIQTMYKIPVTGGMPEKMPIDTAVGLATFSPDGQSIAYNRIFRNFRTWKRYNGGLAQDVYTFNFKTRKLDRITDWSGTDTSPMWYGRKIYYLSDRDANRRANIWVHDLDTGKDREVTHFTDYDIDFPALGGDAISFQQGGKLWLLSLPDEKLQEVPVALPDDNTRTRVHVASVSDQIRSGDPAGQTDFALAPNGKRTLFSARGDIFSVPTEHGATRDLTGTQSADEDHPAWSPDGSWVAYTTDANGNQQLAIRPADGGKEKLLTDFTSGYLYGPVWSPGGKNLAVSDGNHRLWLVSASGGSPKLIAQDKDSEIHDQSFSPDGRWIAFTMTAHQDRRDLYFYSIADRKLTRVGDGMNVNYAPQWSSDGKYLFFISARNENMALPNVDFDFAELKSFGIYAIPLAKDTPSAIAPRSDEGALDVEKDDKEAKDKDDSDKPDIKNGVLTTPISIDFDGMMARADALPIASANIDSIDVRAGKIIYLTDPVATLTGPLPGEDSKLHIYDIKKRTDLVIADKVDRYSISGNGQSVLIKQGHSYKVVLTKPDALEDQANVHGVDLDHMRMLVDPRKEWNEMFENAWRLERDMFFNEKMNGVDWQAVHDKYVKLLPTLGSREDLNYLIGEMIGEMSNSHTYVGGGDDGDTQPQVDPALLGADWALDKSSGRYRIARIYPGDSSRPEYRSPLAQPGLAIHEGDYVLAINGVELKAPVDPDELMQTTDTNTPVDLQVASTPDGARHDVLVKPIGTELDIREAAQIKHNRETVDRLSNGRIGYVYLTDMGARGLQQFVRQFYAQTNKEAMIVDDRWNGGGFIAPYALERLRRTLAALDVGRERAVQTEPSQLVIGPKVALLNHWSASDGDIFPYLFKKYGLGELIGTRSWGGVRGIRGEWPLMDGGYITIPEFAMYNTEGQWAIENHGVQPDIVVENDPADLLAGHDKQLETAVAVLMQKLQGKSFTPPAPPPLVPAYPADGIVPPKP